MSEAHGAPMEARPLATRLEEAETLKTLGNDQYGKKNYAVAVTHYIDAISRLPARIDDGPGPEGEEGNEGGDDGGAPSASEAEGAEASTSATDAPRTPAEPARTITLEEHLLSDQTVQLRVKLYANLAACHLKLVRRALLTQEQYDDTIKASTEGTPTDSRSARRRAEQCQGAASPCGRARKARRLGAPELVARR